MRIFLSLILFIFFLPLLLAADPAIVQLEQAPEPPFDPPKIQKKTFANGIRLTFLENRELPVFEMNAFFEFGLIHEPAEKKGITPLLMHTWHRGGSTSQSADGVDKILEETATTIGADVDREYSTLELKTPAWEVERILPLFFELIRKPGFDEKRFALAKAHSLEAILRRNEDPMEVAEREFRELLYGEENVWARQASLTTVEGISREEILHYYQDRVSPDNIRLAVSGNIDFEKLVDLLDHLFSDWPKRDLATPQPQALSKEWKPALYFIPKEVNQSSVVMGHFGDKRFNPDKYALILANYILGGSTFGSRLGSEIRSNLGLAYGVYASFGLETDYGTFFMLESTKSASTLKVIEESRKILEELRTEKPPSEKELDDAKASLLNQLVFQYEDPFNSVKMEMRFDFYGYPPDYLKIYQAEIRKVTLNQVRRVFRDYFFPERLIVLVVGNRGELKTLKSLGEVRELPLDLD